MKKISSTLWPTFAPIDITFDKQLLTKEIFDSGILNTARIVTPTRHPHGHKSSYDHDEFFKDARFAKNRLAPYFTEEKGILTFTESLVSTFYQTNLTYPGEEVNLVWHKVKGHRAVTDFAKPAWIEKDFAWNYKPFNVPQLKQVIDSLGFDYVSMVRIIFMGPNSIGIVHRDCSLALNQEYFDNGGGSITLNVSDGGAHLNFIDSSNQEHEVDESKHHAWHFDDSRLHCTDETKSERIQIRVYGKHPSYKNLVNTRNAIW